MKSINGPTSERVLLRFDLSGMAGQGVDVVGDATITLNVATGSPTGLEYRFYEIAPANAGWQESTNNTVHNPTTASVKANNGDPTWYYKSIDATLDPTTTTAATDTTSLKWASGQTTTGPIGSNPEGYANTGGLWNNIDLVDQDLSTPVTSYLDIKFNMDPVASATLPASGAVNFTIPEAMIQSWIDNPAANAGLLGRFHDVNALVWVLEFRVGDCFGTTHSYL